MPHLLLLLQIISNPFQAGDVVELKGTETDDTILVSMGTTLMGIIYIVYGSLRWLMII